MIATDTSRRKRRLKSDGEDGKVCGVTMALVDERVLRDAFEETFGKNKAPPKDVTKLVNEMAAHFEKTTPKGESLMKCDECGGGSPHDFDHCPFCGGSDDGPDSAETEATPPNPPQNGALVLAGSSPPAVMEGSGPRTEDDLDAAIVRISDVRARCSHDMWLLGKELRLIFDEKLWQLRGARAGKPAYKDFTQFVNKEVDLHTRTVFKLIGLVREFQEPQIARYGQSILKALLAVPKDERQPILDAVDRGEVKGSRGVAAQVAEIRGRKGIEVVEAPGKKPRTGKATKASAKKASSNRAQTITVPFPTGRLTIDAYARQASKKDPPKRAKRLVQRPWGKHELSNGVVLYVSIVERANGDLQFSIEARREE